MWRGTLSSRLRSKRAPSRRSLAACLVAAGTLLGAVALAAPSSAAPSGADASRPELLRGSDAPRVPTGTAQTGVLAASQLLTVDVTLGFNNQAELTALLNGLASPASPYYHDFLTPAEFNAAFGPTTQQVDDVESALRADGLTPGPASQDGLSIPVTATAAQLEHAFGVTLATYRLPGGRAAYANTAAPSIQQDVAPYVTGILGLNDLYQAHPAVQPAAADAATSGSASTAALASTASAASTASVAAAAPKACVAGTRTPYDAGYPLSKFASYYGLSWLYGLGDEGQGSRIAVLELQPTVASDITAFKKCYDISTAVSYTQVGAQFNPKDYPPADSTEAPLDIEVAAALAPRASIDVLQATNSSTSFYEIINKFVTADTDKTLSISWGLCESESSPSMMHAVEKLIEKADAQGQTVVAAAGDDGATDCFDESGDGTIVDPANSLDVNFPASSPYAISVGGTRTTLAGSNEVVWNESAVFGGAGGGGISAICMPGYQDQAKVPGVINPGDATDVDSSASCPTGHYREVPDVSADADPLTGYIVYIHGQGGWIPFGGTSAATPLMAAVAALTDASPFCAGYGSGSAGLLPQALYAATAGSNSYIYGATSVPEVLRDVVSGNNDYTPSGDYSGDYSAGPGFDLASGLGTPVVPGYRGGRPSTYNPGLTALMCRQLATRHLTRIGGIAGAGPANTAVQVALHATGLLPVAGADLVRVYSGSTLLATSAPPCTASDCTVTLPKEPAGTVVSLAVSTEDGPYTSPVAASPLTYVNAPHITTISPSRGTINGGTRVTIKGANFVGVKSVTFNAKAGTHLSVSGTGTLTVIAPKGPAKVRIKVVVNAAGGTSNWVLYTYT
ncbi:MAG: hypothetical protein JWM19_2393 [Actinomycetia bacterium]|nr:hypothetical protein [Actinomycetes bacterium]